MRLIVEARNKSGFVSVTGAVDEASIEVIHTAVRESIESSTRVELDLRGVYPRETDRGPICAWARACARERDVKLVIRSAERSTSPATRSGPDTSGCSRAGTGMWYRPARTSGSVCVAPDNPGYTVGMPRTTYKGGKTMAKDHGPQANTRRVTGCTWPVSARPVSTAGEQGKPRSPEKKGG